MSDITNLLVALTFVVIGIAFLIAFFVIRCKLGKNVKQILNNQSRTSSEDSIKVIENNKKIIWYLGIAYVTIALALFFEGIGGVSTIKVLNALFVAFGVVFFLYGVVLTAYGVLALYNTKEKKYGKMQKAVLTTICNLKDGKKVLVFVPESSFGAEALANAEVINEEAIFAFRKANGRILDFCIVDDASNYVIGNKYIIYTNILRMKYMGINITFLTPGAIDAVVTNVAEPKQEVKIETKPEEKKVKTVKKGEEPKKVEAKKVETKIAQPQKAETKPVEKVENKKQPKKVVKKEVKPVKKEPNKTKKEQPKTAKTAQKTTKKEPAKKTAAKKVTKNKKA